MGLWVNTHMLVGLLDVFVHFACGVVGEYNMLVGLWVCVFISFVGLWLNTHMLVGLRQFTLRGKLTT